MLDLSAKSSLTIGAGQTLQGKGTVLLGESTILTVAGLLSPGNSPGLLTYNGGTTILTGTTLMEIWGTSRGVNPGYDAIDVVNGGTLTLGGLLRLDFNQNYANDTSFLLVDATGGSLGGAYSSFTVTGSNSDYVGLTFTLQSPGVWETGNAVNDQKLKLTQTDDALTLDVIYAAVPEPSTLALAALGLAAAGVALRKRRRS